MKKLKVDLKTLYTPNRIKFEVEMDGIVFLIGPSGIGKTSLMRCLAGLDNPLEGEISWGKEAWYDDFQKINLTPCRRRIALVGQEDRLFEHLNVLDNILYGYKRVQEENSFDKDEVIQLFGLSNQLKKMPYELSGGEKQKVALARSILSNPGLLLLDEPMSALDHWSKQEIYPFLKLVNTKMKIPILYITHNKDEYFELAQKFIFFSSLDGENKILVNAIGKEGDPFKLLSISDV